MTTFVAVYDAVASYGAYEEKIALVQGSTEAEALGHVLMEHSDTNARYWTLTSVNLAPGEVMTLHQRES